jgi:integrase
LRLLILTGVRSDPLRHIRFDEIEEDVWTVPSEKVKGRVGRTEDFRVPLSREALRIIELARPFARHGYLFASPRSGVISDMTMSALMKRRGMSARPHGFRSSLRDWLAETTDAPHEVAKMVLGHTTHGSSVRAYRRTDFLEERRFLLGRWAEHITGGSGKLVALAERMNGTKRTSGASVA